MAAGDRKKINSSYTVSAERCCVQAVRSRGIMGEVWPCYSFVCKTMF